MTADALFTESLEPAGLAQAAEHADGWWESMALQAIRYLASSGREFQCYELVTECGLVEPDDPSRWGSVFHRAKREGLIVPVGAAPSLRPTVAGSLVRTWKRATP